MSWPTPPLAWTSATEAVQPEAATGVRPCAPTTNHHAACPEPRGRFRNLRDPAAHGFESGIGRLAFRTCLSAGHIRWLSDTGADCSCAPRPVTGIPQALLCRNPAAVLTGYLPRRQEEVAFQEVRTSLTQPNQAPDVHAARSDLQFTVLTFSAEFTWLQTHIKIT